MFSERIKLLRDNRKLSQQDVSKELGVAPSTYSMYEQGKREPDFATLIKISDLFNVSTDYLLGRTDIETFYPNENIDDDLKKRIEDLEQFVLDVKKLISFKEQN